MNKLFPILVASAFAFGSAAALAADAPKEAPKAAAEMKLEKPADVSKEAWDKMTDAEKKKAVEKSKSSTTASKKQKKGGC